MTPTDLPEWHVLAQRRRALEQIHIADLFDDDPQRTERFSFEAASLSVDLSRNRIDSGTLRALVALARASNLEKQRDDLLAGAVVNATEARPAWHTALRSTPTDPFVDPAWGARLQGERERFLQFAEQLRAGHVAGATGLALETVVCIGIGGSDLGPRLVTEALGPARRPCVRFAANLDPADLDAALAEANPHTTLLLAISKSFSTLETVENLKAALRWLKQRAPELDPKSHLAAVTSQPDRATALGIDPARVFPFPEWVGGRYSLWSACGLGIAIARGAGMIDLPPTVIGRAAGGGGGAGCAFRQGAAGVEPAGSAGNAGRVVRELLGHQDARRGAVLAGPAAAARLPAAARDGEPGQARGSRRSAAFHRLGTGRVG